MKEVKYQVFISSTYNDLIEERRKVLEILLMADCIPAGMESFVATDNEQFEVIKRVIDFCDYYILIIGKRYGSVSPESGKSYTEMEYDYAITQGIPVLVFAIDDSVKLPDDKIEQDPDKKKKLKSFREKAMTNRMATIWKTSSELTERLAISIMKAKQEIKRPGWQRAENYDEASLRREIMELQAKNCDLLNENAEKQRTIDSFKENSDLQFEECIIHFEYYYYAGSSRIHRKIDIPLVDIFKVISLQLLDVSKTESSLEFSIKNSLIDNNKHIHFSDAQIIKVVLNQLQELGLIFSKWSSENKNLYWGITAKGKRLRNELTLIRKRTDT